MMNQSQLAVSDSREELGRHRAFPLRGALASEDATRGSVYLLEDSREFDRLEDQEKKEGYRCADDLAEMEVPAGALVLDAGCGSGVVARYIARKFPRARVIGCDKTAERVRKAALGSVDFRNIEYQVGDLTQLGFANDTFDVAICRYVIHHFPNDNGARMDAVRELHRCHKPGGQVTFVDPSSMFYEMNNQTRHVREYLEALRESGFVDLEVGRYLPVFMRKSGFLDVTWEAKPICSRSELLQQEHDLMAARLEQIRGEVSRRIVGGVERYDRFRDEFLGAFRLPDTVYYSVRVIAKGRKAGA